YKRLNIFIEMLFSLMPEEVVLIIINTCNDPTKFMLKNTNVLFKSLIKEDLYISSDFFTIGGHLNCLKWLNDLGYLFNENTFKNACSNGDIEILKWLDDIGYEYEYIPNEAIENCHLEVLKWLLQRNYRFKKYAFDYTVKNKSVELFELLWSSKCIPDKNVAL